MAPSLLDIIGIHGMFIFFSTVVGISFLYHLIFMPETKGLSLKEIRDMYKSKSQVDKNKILVTKSR